MNEIRKKNRFVAAYDGLIAVYKSEQNFKIHLFAFFAVVFSGFYFGISPLEWMVVLSCAFLVLTCEIFNTAIEKLCDYVHPEFDSNIGRIKDTFPLKRMEGYVLRLVPDQVGEYPVHDHNLLSITGGGLYPFGMFLTILIQ